jgi:hypothetical protein
METLFLCDCGKNKACKKKGCQRYCRLTDKIEAAKLDESGQPIIAYILDDDYDLYRKRTIAINNLASNVSIAISIAGLAFSITAIVLKLVLKA